MPAPNIRLFSPDLDGTLLGNPEASARFTHRWESLDRHRRPLLVYNTGRTVADTQNVVQTRLLPEPDFIIGSVGTELHDSLYNRAQDFRAQFSVGWNLEQVERIVAATPGVRRQPAEFLHAFKSSWIWPRARREQIDGLRQRLLETGLQINVVYSCLHFLDVLPARADKGNALKWLCERLGLGLEHVLVAGDSANDSSMFLLPGVRGILLENSLPELFAEVAGRKMFVARTSLADGVLEGLRHFGVLPEFQPFVFPAATALDREA